MGVNSNWKALHVNHMINGKMVIFLPFSEYTFKEEKGFRIYEKIDTTDVRVPMILTETHMFRYGYDQTTGRKCWRRMRRKEFEEYMNPVEAKYYKKAVDCLVHRRSIKPKHYMEHESSMMNNGPKYECYLDDETAQLMFMIDNYND